MFHYGSFLCKEDRAEEGLKLQLETMKDVDSQPKEAREERHRLDALCRGSHPLHAGPAEGGGSSLSESHGMGQPFPEFPAALGLMMSEQGQAAEALVYHRRALGCDNHWPTKACQKAAKLLHRYPAPSTWTRREALFYARQAAEANDFQDPALVDVLVEACAANGLYERARQLSHAAGHGPEWQAQLARTVAYYRTHEPSRKADTQLPQPKW